MLILTRRIGEAIIIGDDITLTILNSKGNQVRIGVDAPRAVSVHRSEVYDRIQQQKQKAAEKSEQIQETEAQEDSDETSD